MPTCSQCELQPGLREQWGCDTATDRPVYTTACCDRTACADCKGTGDAPIYRCPRAVIKGCGAEMGSVKAAISAYTYLDRWGILPVSGGSIDQAGSFQRFCLLMEDEKNFWKRKAEEKAGREEKMDRVAAAASRRASERLGK